MKSETHHLKEIRYKRNSVLLALKWSHMARNAGRLQKLEVNLDDSHKELNQDNHVSLANEPKVDENTSGWYHDFSFLRL